MPPLFSSLNGSLQGLHTDKLLPWILKDRGVPRTYAWKDMWSGAGVDKMTDLIAQASADQAITLYEAQPMGPEGLLDRVSWNPAQPIRYELQTFGLEAMIPNVYNTAADAIWDFAQRQGAFVVDRVNLRLEYAATVQTLRNAALMTFNTTLLAAQQWSNRSSPDSYPIDDLLTWVRYVREEANRPIAKISMTAPTWQECAQHPTTQARRDVTAWGVLTTEKLEEILRVDKGTIRVDDFGIYKAPGLSGVGSKRYFGGPDVVVLTGGAPTTGDYTFGHMYYLGGSGDDPLVVLRYPEYRTARGAEVVQVTSFVHFLVETPTAAFLALNVVNPALARFRSMLSA